MLCCVVLCSVLLCCVVFCFVLFLFFVFLFFIRVRYFLRLQHNNKKVQVILYGKARFIRKCSSSRNCTNKKMKTEGTKATEKINDPLLFKNIIHNMQNIMHNAPLKLLLRNLQVKYFINISMSTQQNTDFLHIFDSVQHKPLV